MAWPTPRPATASATSTCMVNPELRDDAHARSRLVTAGRRYLDDAGFIEVETPVLQPLYGGATARPFTTHHNELERDLLPAHRHRAVPQAAHRRRARAGLRARQGLPQRGRRRSSTTPSSRWSSGTRPTPTTATACAAPRSSPPRRRGASARRVITRGEREIDMAPPWPRVPLAEAIEEACGIDPMADRDPERLRACAPRSRAASRPRRRRRHLAPARRPRALALRRAAASSSPSSWSTTRPSSRRSRARADDPSTVERFEAFCCGMEFANGYSELNDPELQLRASRSRPRAGRRRRGRPAARRRLRRGAALRHAADRGRRPRHRPPRDARGDRRRSATWCSSRRCATGGDRGSHATASASTCLPAGRHRANA